MNDWNLITRLIIFTLLLIWTLSFHREVFHMIQDAFTDFLDYFSTLLKDIVIFLCLSMLIWLPVNRTTDENN